MTTTKVKQQKLEHIKTESLVPYARNSRIHSDEQVAQIMASIREFGFTNPVLIDDTATIIAGHGRVLAANRMELDKVSCIRLSHLTEAQKRAYVIADNRLALNATWDTEQLANELADLHADDFDLGLLGFDAEELIGLIGDGWDIDPSEIESGGSHTNGIEKSITVDVAIEDLDRARDAMVNVLTEKGITFALRK